MKRLSRGAKNKHFNQKSVKNEKAALGACVPNNVDVSELILTHRESARRLAYTMLRRMGRGLPDDEITSVADIAICEAASRYKPLPGARFTTYLFYFVKGELIRFLSQSSCLIPCGSATEVGAFTSNREAVGYSGEGSGEGQIEGDQQCVQAKQSCPEEQVYLAQVRSLCEHALTKLSLVEKKVLLGAHVEEFQMSGLAKRLGYSRGHLFAIRKAAERKVRRHFDDHDFDLAA